MLQGEKEEIYQKNFEMELSLKKYTESQKFDKEIAVLRVKLRDVGGDGNCMFRAFADQVDGS